ncbi:polysaccharide pyruvyl transferase family protein, partial [Streptomyces sp. NPDC057674]|uniref:polysaccharide pyruvyl transferase family protein n=1 Tax=Streptomyces sp. NPDC057674 TaxID=3346203 RepID=UPI00369032A8
AIAGKGLGKLVDAVRTAAWVRRHDVVIVPGMGVLEATLPLRPWGFPYALFLLCASGRLFGTRVALVGVGAAPIGNRATRALVRGSARLAAYRSYRDDQSRDALRAMGVDTARDEVHPDLAFALPAPPPGAPSATPGPVCVGVMAFHGGDDDRARAEEIHRRYLDGTTRFVRALVADGRPVRLLTGDEADREVVGAILDAVDSPLVTAAETASLADLMKEMAAADAVVATRYHNLVCALRVGVPALALSYAAKSDALMDRMGLGAYCHPAREVDADRLLAAFRELEKHAAELRLTLAERNRTVARQLDEQFTALTAAVFPRTGRAHAHALRETP